MELTKEFENQNRHFSLGGDLIKHLWPFKAQTLLKIELGFELLVPNCFGFSKLHSKLQSRIQIVLTMLAVYGPTWCVLHETSNACIVFTIWLFLVDCDAWRGVSLSYLGV
jgi:hypothetical protein